ncbi:MAG: ribosome-associated translation inhibitor RaiA [Firmicutes bacterium]|nr:ribosome-associated translation inhibitor RaiA [Bacillota bacterium]
MKIEISAKNVEVSPKLKDLIEKKIGRLSKFLPENTRAKVFLKREKEFNVMELTIHADKVMRAEVHIVDDMFTCVDQIMSKITRQISRHKSKIRFLKDINLDEELFHEQEAELKGVVKRKTYILKPMSVEDAKLELELIGHTFYVFQNKDTAEINILYLRNDGNLGLIEAVKE